MYEQECPEYYFFVMKAPNLYYKGRKTSGYKIGVTECSPVKRHWKRTNYFVTSYMHAVTWGIIECLIKAKTKGENQIQVFPPYRSYSSLDKWLHMPRLFEAMYGIKLYIGIEGEGSMDSMQEAEMTAREWDYKVQPTINP
jgi:hypothetical protein